MGNEPRFDELIHAPTRLSIVALLAAADWADFTFVRDSLSLSDSALSKQISILEQAGYVTVRKTGAGRSSPHSPAAQPVRAPGLQRPRRDPAADHHRRRRRDPVTGQGRADRSRLAGMALTAPASAGIHGGHVASAAADRAAERGP